MNNDVNSVIVDPSRWDEIIYLIGGYPVRPYEELRQDPYGALPGFYADDRHGYAVLAFQPGWGGQDSGDAVHWHGLPRPTVGEIRERITSRLISSWLVQDREESGFFLGDEPGSIETPWGTIPAHVVFARRGTIGDDAPWENLGDVLHDVDRALANGAPPRGGFVDWRLRNAVPPCLKVEIYHNPDNALVAVFRQRESDDVVVFLWNADGSPRSGEVQEYDSRGYVGLYDAYPLLSEADLECFLAGVVV